MQNYSLCITYVSTTVNIIIFIIITITIIIIMIRMRMAHMWTAACDEEIIASWCRWFTRCYLDNTHLSSSSSSSLSSSSSSSLLEVEFYKFILMVTSVFGINGHQTRLTPKLTMTQPCDGFQPKSPPHGLRQPNNFRRWQLTSTIIVRGGRWVGGTSASATILNHQLTRHVFPLWYCCDFWIQSHLFVQKNEKPENSTQC